jgi:hypothetical protein
MGNFALDNRDLISVHRLRGVSFMIFSPFYAKSCLKMPLNFYLHCFAGTTEKSPTECVRAQSNHVFMAIYAAFQLLAAIIAVFYF